MLSSVRFLPCFDLFKILFSFFIFRRAISSTWCISATNRTTYRFDCVVLDEIFQNRDDRNFRRQINQFILFRYHFMVIQQKFLQIVANLQCDTIFFYYTLGRATAARLRFVFRRWCCLKIEKKFKCFSSIGGIVTKLITCNSISWFISLATGSCATTRASIIGRRSKRNFRIDWIWNACIAFTLLSFLAIQIGATESNKYWVSIQSFANEKHVGKNTYICNCDFSAKSRWSWRFLSVSFSTKSSWTVRSHDEFHPIFA